MTLLQEISKSSREYRGASKATRVHSNEPSEGYAFVVWNKLEDWTNNTRVVQLPAITRASQRFAFVTRYGIQSEFQTMLSEQMAELRGLENDWDGDDALAPIPANLTNAEQFLLTIYDQMAKIELRLPLPELNPCNDGALDVVWRQAENFLLLHFRNPEQGLVQYYFDQYDSKLARQGALLLSAPTPQDFKLYLQAIVK